MNKLRNNRGETLVESLVSILIAVLAFGILGYFIAYKDLFSTWKDHTATFTVSDVTGTRCT